MTAQQRHEARLAVVNTEIGDLEIELTSVRARSVAAEAAFEAAKSEAAEFDTYATSGLIPSQTISARYHSWLLETRAELLTPATKERGAARSAVEAIEARLADAREESTYLKRAITANHAALRPVTEPSRRRVAPIVEFSDIVPRERTA
jgi:hypothetical protein